MGTICGYSRCILALNKTVIKDESSDNKVLACVKEGKSLKDEVD